MFNILYSIFSVFYFKLKIKKQKFATFKNTNNKVFTNFTTLTLNVLFLNINKTLI